MATIDRIKRRRRERSRTRLTSARPACTSRDLPRTAATLFVSLIPLLCTQEKAQTGTGLTGHAALGRVHPTPTPVHGNIRRKAPSGHTPLDGGVLAGYVPRGPAGSPSDTSSLTNAARATKVADCFPSHRPAC